tara:strand:+ start:2118 stop:2720 length:603 start_codon:yes stop_codon:yes gene_type:complete
MTITQEDNIDLMSRYEDNYFDLAIVDPPYGISNKMKGSRPMGKQIKGKTWNDEIPTKKYFNELLRVSKNQIIWGANYYCNYLKPSRCWVVWDKKMTEKIGFSMNELAYTSFDSTPKTYYKYADRLDRIHPCQKPIKLYEWLLINYAKKDDKILDTHLGSGSIAIACHNLGYDLTACELDKEYYDAAIKRIKQHKEQLKMF